jgi:hypothetical protein
MEVLTLLRKAREAGLTVSTEGNSLVIRGPRRAEPVVLQLAEKKAEVLAALARAEHSPQELDRSVSDPAWWRRHFNIRTIDRELSGFRSHREAELLAFNDLVVEWHKRHGMRPDPRCCAGCGDKLPDHVGLVVDRGGVRVHFDAARRDSCVIAFGSHWRGEAVAGLRALGIDAPSGFTLQ